MADIASRTFVLTPTTDKYLKLGNEEWARTLTIGNTWSQLRIGILAAITPDSTNNITGVTGFVGVCNGKVNTVAQATTNNSIGVALAAATNTNGTLTYNAGVTYPYFTMTGVPQTRVGSTVTTGSTTSSMRITTNTGALQRRVPFYVHITKGSPNFTILPYYVGTTANSETEVSLLQFMQGLEMSGTPTVNVTALTAGSAPVLAVNEGSNGNLDTVNIYWGKAAFPIEIYAIGVHRFA